MKSFCIFLMILVLDFSLGGCAREKQENELTDIKLPSSPVLISSCTFGVCTATYIRIRENPSQVSSVMDTIYQNYIFEIVTGTADDTWYMIKCGDIQGWVSGTDIELFANKESAENFINKK
ncbi:MAG: SH3 domain-containing protein [Spirochaetia bacterium]|nr:SH3 domain-containing protein [Spirochaetia bacterium]